MILNTTHPIGRTVHVEAFHVTQRRHSHGAGSRYRCRPVMRARTTNKTRHSGCEDKSFRKSKRDMS
jgi:hypothetical protein